MHIVICEPYRLIYAPLPKCALTTMIKLLTDLGGVGNTRNPRDCPIRRADEAAPGHGGTYSVACDESQMQNVAAVFQGFRWFSIVRDPYSRVESNYHNKLNRYARRFLPVTYALSYAGTLRPHTWTGAGSSERIRRMQKTISFEGFVMGLAQHGTGWDPHYMPQADLLLLNQVSFHHLLRMESLVDELTTMFAVAGMEDAGREAIHRLGHLNRSPAGEAANPWTPRTRAIVADLYRQDFEKLGYAA